LLDLDVVDAQVLEDLLVDRDGRAGRLAVVADPGVRLLAVDGEGDGALLLQALEGAELLAAVGIAAVASGGATGQGQGQDARGRDSRSGQCASLCHGASSSSWCARRRALRPAGTEPTLRNRSTNAQSDVQIVYKSTSCLHW